MMNNALQTFKYPCLIGHQGGRRVLTISAKFDELSRLLAVDKLSHTLNRSQRELNSRRASAFADYVINGLNTSSGYIIPPLIGNIDGDIVVQESAESPSFGFLVIPMTDLLDDEPGMMAVERTPIPSPLWVKVNKWGDGSVFSGLADPMAELAYFDGADDPRATRTIRTPAGDKRVVDFCDEDELSVDPDSAEFIVWEEYPRLVTQARNGLLTPGSAAQYYLRFGVIQIAAGKAAMYDRMMERGQTMHRLALSGQQTMAEIAARKDLRVLDDQKFRWVTAKTIQARIIQMNWWCCLYLVLSQYQDDAGRFMPVMVSGANTFSGRAA